MPTFKVYKNENYTIMSNYHLQDKNLSLKSKGLLSQMLSLPPSWDYSIKGLAAINKDGIDAIKSALKELEKYDYLVRRKVRDCKGRIVDIEYLIYELPLTKNKDSESSPLDEKTTGNDNVKPKVEKPHMVSPEVENPHMEKPHMVSPEVEKPHMEKPHMEKPYVEKPTQLNTKEYNTKEYNTKELNTKKINTKEKNTNELNIKSINQSNTPITHQVPIDNQDDGLMDRLEYEKLIKANVDYESLSAKYDKDIQRLNEVIDIVVDTVTYNTQPMKISKTEYPAEAVKSVFLKLNSQHIDSVMKIISNNTGNIKNPKNYLISCLYNSYLIYSNSNAMSVSKHSEYYVPKNGNVFTNYTQRNYTDEEIEEIIKRKASNT